VPINTPTFIAGVGILVSLDLAVLGISVQNARNVGTDTKAREKARKAHNEAREVKATVRADGMGDTSDD